MSSWYSIYNLKSSRLNSLPHVEPLISSSRYAKEVSPERYALGISRYAVEIYESYLRQARVMLGIDDLALERVQALT